MVREAKKDGVAVTAEVCPHHFSMCEDDIVSNDGNFKMNPPLRSKADVQALREGLRDGIMEVISTDHAPHHAEEKAKPVTEAPFGIVGSETAVALTITNLVDTGYLTPMQMAEKMSYNPAKILGLNKGVIEAGAPADLVIFDAGAKWVIDPEAFASKGKNTPFAGKTVSGKVRVTISDGEVAFADKDFFE